MREVMGATACLQAVPFEAHWLRATSGTLEQDTTEHWGSVSLRGCLIQGGPGASDLCQDGVGPGRPGEGFRALIMFGNAIHDGLDEFHPV